MRCNKLDQTIKLPSSVTNLAEVCWQCDKVKITEIPRYVTNLYNAFSNCYAISGRINIYATDVTNTNGTFYGTTSKKQVYIYFTYKNGVRTPIYNYTTSGSSAYGNHYWNTYNGVTIYNLGAAPW